MAIPTSMVKDTNTRSQSGIIIGIAPTTGKRYRVELQRSTQGTTGTTTWKSIFLDPSTNQFSYTDLLPLSTRTYYYRSRHFGLGVTNSSFSAIVNAKPQRIPEVWTPQSMQRNSKNNYEVLAGDVWMTSSKTVKVGTQQTTGTVTKIQRLAGAQALPDTSTTIWDVSNGDFRSASNTLAAGAQATVFLPPGVKVIKYRMRSFCQSVAAGDAVTALFRRLTTTGGITNLSTANQSANGWVTTTGSAVSETISTSYVYQTRLVVNPNTVKADARFLYWEFVYTMPDYQKNV